MEAQMQTIDVSPSLGIECDDNSQVAGITVEEWMDLLDERLIAHFGEDFRNRVNASRQRWNKTGRWSFDNL